MREVDEWYDSCETFEEFREFFMAVGSFYVRDGEG